MLENIREKISAYIGTPPIEELKKAADNKASAQAWRYTQLRVAYEAQKQKPTKSVGGPHSEL